MTFGYIYNSTYASTITRFNIRLLGDQVDQKLDTTCKASRSSLAGTSVPEVVLESLYSSVDDGSDDER